MFYNNNKLVFCNNWFAKTFLMSGYSTIMLFLMILSKDKKLSKATLNHENIHRVQYVELAIVGFVLGIIIGCICLCKTWLVLALLPFTLGLTMYYIWYLAEYLVSFVAHLFIKHDDEQSCEYYASALETEAHTFDDNLDYLVNRKPFAWLRYLGNICCLRK